MNRLFKLYQQDGWRYTDIWDGTSKKEAIEQLRRAAFNESSELFLVKRMRDGDEEVIATVGKVVEVGDKTATIRYFPKVQLTTGELAANVHSDDLLDWGVNVAWIEEVVDINGRVVKRVKKY